MSDSRESEILPMTVLLRFANLKANGIVSSWPQLRRLIELHGFPKGRLLSPNVRAWTGDEIDEWRASRPTEPAPAPARQDKEGAQGRRRPARGGGMSHAARKRATAGSRGLAGG
jgi:hypothetical protein